MRVTDRTRWIFVEVHAASGVSGIGEASLQNRETEVAAALRARGAALTGRDAEPDPTPIKNALSLPEASRLRRR